MSEAVANRVRNNSVTPQTRRTLLIVLGYGRIEYPTKALEGAMEFVRKRLLPQDAVAVMGFHRATEFTTDHERIAQILERYRKAHEKIVFEIDEFRIMSRSPPQLAGGRSGGVGGAAIPEKFLKTIDEIFTGASAGSAPPAPAAESVALRNTADLLFAMDRAVPVVDKPGQHQETFEEIRKGLADTGDELTDEVPAEHAAQALRRRGVPALQGRRETSAVFRQWRAGQKRR